jgi:hypothetical protein
MYDRRLGVPQNYVEALKWTILPQVGLRCNSKVMRRAYLG